MRFSALGTAAVLSALCRDRVSDLGEDSARGGRREVCVCCRGVCARVRGGSEKEGGLDGLGVERIPSTLKVLSEIKKGTNERESPA